MNVNWTKFLIENANHYPDKVAIIEQLTGRTLTYSNLLDLTNKQMIFLKEHGVNKGDNVTFLSCNRIEHITLLLACSHLGALFTPLNFKLSKNEITRLVKRINPKLSITHSDYKGYIEETIDLEQFNKEVESINIPQNIECLYNKTSLKDPALMLFTSGSTGAPKGVLLHGQMIETNQIETIKNWGLEHSDSTIVETPFFHTGGYNVLCLPLLRLGGTIVLATKFDVDNVYQTIDEHQISVYFGVPTMFQMIEQDKQFKSFSFSSVRFFISGGAACPVETIKSYQKKNVLFKQGFGLTEVGPNCFLLSPQDAIKKVGSIGRPMPHSDVIVVDRNHNKVTKGEIGELLIKGDHLCKSYFKQDHVFQESCFNGYFKTGDLVCVDEDGFFFVKGRIKEMYISGGENVYPAEVEKQLYEHNEIKDAVIVPVPHEKWGEVGFCFILTKNDINLSLEDLMPFLKENLSRYKHPRYIKRLESFPQLANGKIDKKSLKSKALELIGEQ